MFISYQDHRTKIIEMKKSFMCKIIQKHLPEVWRSANIIFITFIIVIRSTAYDEVTVFADRTNKVAREQNTVSHNGVTLDLSARTNWIFNSTTVQLLVSFYILNSCSRHHSQSEW